MKDPAGPLQFAQFKIGDIPPEQGVQANAAPPVMEPTVRVTYYMVTFRAVGKIIVRTIEIDETETDNLIMHIQRLPEYTGNARLIHISYVRSDERIYPTNG